jgi:hypothetical protein
VPAYVRRYPFILATGENDPTQFTVCIDEDCPGFNKKGKGTALFDEDGNESDLLKNSVEFLKEYQNHIQLTTLFCKHIKDLGLLEPMKADIKLADVYCKNNKVRRIMLCRGVFLKPLNKRMNFTFPNILRDFI